MRKVLIADDERKICQLIEKLVDWDALEMQVVAVAANGIEALERIREFHPDIVITDIRMPGYDGLDLIRLGKEEAPEAEFVIISGYRHFEYAQTAIRYGVSAYLLKPIKKDELTETLKKIGARFREQTEQLSQDEKERRAVRNDEKNLRQAFLLDLAGRRNKEALQSPIETINREFHYHFSEGEFCVAILKPDGSVCNEEENVRYLSGKIRSAAKKYLDGAASESELVLLDGFYYFLLNYDPNERMRLRRQMKALLSEIRGQEDILKNLTVTLALGTGVMRLSEIDASLKNARLLIEERLIGGTGTLMEGDITGGESFADSEVFTKFNDRISHTLESLDSFAVRDELIGLKTQMLALKEISGHEILQMTKEICNQYLFFMRKYRLPVEENFLESFNLSADNCSDAAELFDFLIRRITGSYEKAARLKRQDENRPVRIAKKYVEEHYAEPLTIEQVSQAADLSATYLSTIFKKDTGMTCLEYLSKVRMDTAKQLLKETNYTVADICGRVGYSDVRYFTKSFIKYAGLKPKEYRKLYS